MGDAEGEADCDGCVVTSGVLFVISASGVGLVGARDGDVVRGDEGDEESGIGSRGVQSKRGKSPECLILVQTPFPVSAPNDAPSNTHMSPSRQFILLHEQKNSFLTTGQQTQGSPSVFAHSSPEDGTLQTRNPAQSEFVKQGSSENFSTRSFSFGRQTHPGEPEHGLSRAPPSEQKFDSLQSASISHDWPVPFPESSQTIGEEPVFLDTQAVTLSPRSAQMSPNGQASSPHEQSKSSITTGLQVHAEEELEHGSEVWVSRQLLAPAHWISVLHGSPVNFNSSSHSRTGRSIAVHKGCLVPVSRHVSPSKQFMSWHEHLKSKTMLVGTHTQSCCPEQGILASGRVQLLRPAQSLSFSHFASVKPPGPPQSMGGNSRLTDAHTVLLPTIEHTSPPKQSRLVHAQAKSFGSIGRQRHPEGVEHGNNNCASKQ